MSPLRIGLRISKAVAPSSSWPAAPRGCHDFSLAADPLDTGRVNVFEAWETTDAVEAFRGSGPDDTQSSMIISAVIRQYEVESVTDLSG